MQKKSLRFGTSPGHGHNFTSAFQVALILKQNRNTCFFNKPWLKYLLVYRGKMVRYHGKLLEHLIFCHAWRYALQIQQRWEWGKFPCFTFHSLLPAATIATSTHLIKSSVRRSSACWSRTAYHKWTQGVHMVSIPPDYRAAHLVNRLMVSFRLEE